MPKRVEVGGLYPENDWTFEKIEKEIKERTSVKEYIIALHDQDVSEDGKPKKPHFHVYLNFGNTNWTFAAVAKWFGLEPQFVEKIKADPKDEHPTIGKYYVLRYFTHAAYPEKHFYPVSSFVTNIENVEEFFAREQENALKRAKKGANVDLAELLEKCSTGQIMPYDYPDKISSTDYAKYEPQLKRAWNMYRARRVAGAKGHRNCQILWLYGATGRGKTELAKLFAEQLGKPFYLTASGGDPMGNYADQPFIILDEVRAGEGFTYKELLQFLDPFTMTATKSRYYNKVAMADWIVVTSPYSPAEYYKLAVPVSTDIDSAGQLYRRVSQVWHVLPDTIECSRYDMAADSFVSLGQKEYDGFVGQERSR